VLKGFADLLDRNLLVEARTGPEPVPEAPLEAPPARRDTGWLLWAGVAVIAALAFFLVPRSPWNPMLHGAGDSPLGSQIMKAASLYRLERLERGVRVFYDASGKYPRSLEDLIGARIVQDETLRDPFSRAYRYILRSDDGKFGLYGRNARGDIDLDLSFDRTLAPVTEIRPVAAKKPAENKPGVQVID
jgi:hypothetical protein